MGEVIKAGIIGLAVAIIVSVFVSGMTGNYKESVPTANVVKNTGEYQEIKLSFKNYQYKLEPSNLVKDVPVRMIVDTDSVYGCMRDVVIPAFGVKKYVKQGDNIIEFLPDKTGTFNIACSMNMGRGTFSVTETDGTKSDFVEEKIEGSSCGTENGCGCSGYQ